MLDYFCFPIYCILWDILTVVAVYKIGLNVINRASKNIRNSTNMFRSVEIEMWLIYYKTNTNTNINKHIILLPSLRSSNSAGKQGNASSFIGVGFFMNSEAKESISCSRATCCCTDGKSKISFIKNEVFSLWCCCIVVENKEIKSIESITILCSSTTQTDLKIIEGTLLYKVYATSCDWLEFNIERFDWTPNPRLQGHYSSQLNTI